MFYPYRKIQFLSLFVGLSFVGACSNSKKQIEINPHQESSDPTSGATGSSMTTHQTAQEKQAEIAIVKHQVSLNYPTVLTAVIKNEKYMNALKQMNVFETNGLLRVLFNPNTSRTQVDVAPFLVIEFSPAFFTNKQIAEALEVLGISEFVVERSQPVPPVKLLDSEGTPSPFTGAGYFPSKIMGTDELPGQYSGKGSKIAIIDTGFDFGHPMLKVTPSGAPKIIDFKDFTRDGRYYLSPLQDFAKAKELFSNHLQAEMPTDQDAAFYETRIVEERVVENRHIKVDLNGDEATNMSFLAWVLVSKKDSQTWIGVDLNSDDVITVDEIVKTFNPKFQGKLGDSILKFGDGRLKGFREVLPRVEWNPIAKTAVLELGFEENGHGTHVAGIAAGYMPGQGKLPAYKGVAPEAQVIAIKVCELPKGCTDAAMVQGMIYAAQSGADVINMSLGGGQALSQNSIYAQLVRYLTQKFGVLFVISAGNNGPGLNTTKDPGNFDAALTVGAYNTSESAADNYGVPGLPGFVFWWSSRGPTRFGAPKPSVLAPGAAVSSVPQFHGSGWEMLQGTSMAAPMATGLAAVLLDAAKSKSISLVSSDSDTMRSQRPISLRRAMEEGSKPVECYDVFEQGYGLVHAPSALQKLEEWDLLFKQRLEIDPNYLPFRYLSIRGHYFDQNSTDEGLHTVTIEEFRDPSFLKRPQIPKIEDSLQIRSRQNWIQLRNKAGIGGTTDLENIDPALGKNTFTFEFSDELRPKGLGVHAGVLEIKDKALGIPQGRVFITDINPVELSSENRRLRLDGNQEASYFWERRGVKIKAAENKRIFVRVQKGITALAVRLKGVQNGADSFNDARLFVTFVFKGQAVKQEVNALDIRSNRVVVDESFVGIPVTETGIYEIIVTGSTQVAESICNLEIRASGVSNQSPELVSTETGHFEIGGIEGIKEKSWALKPVVTPWMVLEDIQFSMAEPRNLIDIGIGSTLGFVHNYRGPFRVLPQVKQKMDLGYLSPLLSEVSGKVLVEDVDYSLSADGGFYVLRGKARPILVHLYAEYLPKGFDKLGVKVLTQIAAPPFVETVRTGPNSFKARGVNLSGELPENAFVLFSWTDSFLGYSTTTGSETAFVKVKGKAKGNFDFELFENSSESLSQVLGLFLKSSAN